MKLVQGICVVSFMAGVVEGYYGWGSCPEPTDVLKNLDIEKYMGKWFDYYSDASIRELNDFSCGVHTYTLTDRKKKLFKEDYNYEIWYWPFNAHGFSMDVQCLKDGSGQCDYDINQSQTFNMDKPKLQILDTDYVTYTVVYSCWEDWGLFYRDALWVLTRQNTPAFETMEALIRPVVAEKIPWYDYESHAKYQIQGR